MIYSSRKKNAAVYTALAASIGFIGVLGWKVDKTSAEYNFRNASIAALAQANQRASQDKTSCVFPATVPVVAGSLLGIHSRNSELRVAVNENLSGRKKQIVVSRTVTGTGPDGTQVHLYVPSFDTSGLKKCTVLAAK